MTLWEFLDMGGYAFYVWSSYGLTAVILFFNWFNARRRFRLAVQSVQNSQRALEGDKNK
ncbi:MAG: heme exporter protein CcmD [Gammaproteobacteria bacterium WSBS_2016_MAG_OTU1]